MNIARLRLVTFDSTGTLLQFRSGPGKQYGEIGAIYGVLCDRDTLAANFEKQWRRMNTEHPNFGLNTGIGWEKWWKIIVQESFRGAKHNVCDDKKLESIANDLIEAYKTSICWQQCYGALDLLEYLKNKGLILGVISNYDPRLHSVLENMKMRHFFKFVLTSYEAKTEKPNSEIFSQALKLSELPEIKSSESLHIGDTPLLDYIGAKNAGFKALLVNDKDPKIIQEKYPDVDKEHVFRNLYDLQRYLQSNEKN